MFQDDAARTVAQSFFVKLEILIAREYDHLCFRIVFGNSKQLLRQCVCVCLATQEDDLWALQGYLVEQVAEADAFGYDDDILTGREEPLHCEDQQRIIVSYR
jgi:hypothetical protein